MRANARGVLVGAALVAAGALAACAGGTNGANAGLAAPLCPLPAGVTAALAYPAPGAMNVPDNIAQIVIAVSSPLPATWGADVLAPSGTVTFLPSFVTIAPSAIPTPYATPAFANPVYESSTTVALPAASLITVLASDSTIACTTFPQIGTFTTQ
jgi:hypothetical protein